MRTTDFYIDRFSNPDLVCKAMLTTSNNWVCGYFFESGGECYIINENGRIREVRLETVRRFLQFWDKNNHPIFENDLLAYEFGVIRYFVIANNFRRTAKMKLLDEKTGVSEEGDYIIQAFGFSRYEGGLESDSAFDYPEVRSMDENDTKIPYVEVVGNAFDFNDSELDWLLKVKMKEDEFNVWKQCRQQILMQRM